MAADIPKQVLKAISDGGFERYMENYKLNRISHSINSSTNTVFLDIGDYSHD